MIEAHEQGESDARYDVESISSDESPCGDYDDDGCCRSGVDSDMWDTGTGWESATVWMTFQVLPGVDQLAELMKMGSADEILSHPNASPTAVLLAVWMNERQLLRRLLELMPSGARAADSCGRTALHLAAYRGHPDCIRLLLEARAPPNVWDTAGVATPLHCAAGRGCALSVQLLLDAGADVNAGLAAGRSALHCAVRADAPDCVETLLGAGACPNPPQVFTETPLHVACALARDTCVRLLLAHGADVRVQCGAARSTALHLAAADGNVECVRLLLAAGARPDAPNSRAQTALHVACLAQSVDAAEALLAAGAAPDAPDADGRTPLHCAIAKGARGTECVALLLRAGASVNRADAFGYTAVHLAALNEHSAGVLQLLEHGGDLTARTNGGASALSFVVRRTPDVIPAFVRALDASVQLTDHELGDVDCELRLDFRLLVPCVGRGETELLLNFIEAGHRAFLTHPLCETFLHLKWRRIRKFFVTSLICHAVFVAMFTAYVVGVYLRDCPSAGLTDAFMAFDLCQVALHVRVLGVVLLAVNVLFLAKELFQVAHGLRAYVLHWDNWLQWFSIVAVFACVSPGQDIKTDVATWQHHAAATGIFLAWLELMMIVGRFPMFGLYVQMFTTVAINFSKFLLAYSCLLIAFGLSFGVLFANYKSFNNLLVGLLKTVIMMSGELEFEDIFYDNSAPIQYSGTAHIFFLAFVLLVTVILTNLMVGLAVSDIQGLQQSAGLDRLVRQAELIAHLESMLFSPMLRRFPKRLLALFHRTALLLTSQYHWTLYIRPNDPRETKIPKELIKNIYQLVVGRRERLRARCNKSIKSNCATRNGSAATKIPATKSETELSKKQSETELTLNTNNLKSDMVQLADDLKRYHCIIEQKLNEIHKILNPNER